MPESRIAIVVNFLLRASDEKQRLLAQLADVHFLLIVALFALIMIYFLLLLRREKDEKLNPLALAYGKSRRWIERKSSELEKDGEFKGAGDLYMAIQRFEDAAKMYVQGKALGRAAEAFLKMNDRERAAKAFERRGMYLRAADLYKEAGKAPESARAYLQADRPLQAAEVLASARKFSEAAEIYRKYGHTRKAGELYYKTGNKLSAAQTLEESFREETERLPGDLKPSNSRMLSHIATLIGAFYEQEGKVDEAAAAYESGGHLAEAARLHEKVGRYSLASQLYVSAGKPFEAAICEDKSGKKEEAALIRAEAYRQRGQYIEAVSNYEVAKKPLEAAYMYIELDEHPKAARMFERAGKFVESAEEYVLADEKDLAAAALEKAREFTRAADMYGEVGNPSKRAQMLESAGKHFAAACIYHDSGAVENSIRALQRVGETDSDFPPSQLLLADIFREKGIPKIAAQYYRRVLGGKKPDRSSLQSFYNMGVTLESIGALRDALEIYEAIIVIDYHFGDVSDRIQLIQDRISAMTPGTPSESSLSSIYDSTAPGDANATQVSMPNAPRPRRYEIIEEIGRGGMGIVYKARDTVLDRIVAYKVLPANLREHPQAVKNFFREAKSAAALNHPNIVTVHDAGEEDGAYYIAMEFLKGRTIKQFLLENGRLPVKAVIFTTVQILRALGYAHERKIVHRDIKSSNIMWMDDKIVKIMDFGLAKVVEEYKASQTVASGTPYYMSPEQTLGDVIDHRTDLYSLGVTVFEMVTGRLPFPDGQAAYHHVHTDPPEPVECAQGIPLNINKFILRLMAKDPADRYQSANETLEALKHIGEEVKESADYPDE